MNYLQKSNQAQKQLAADEQAAKQWVAQRTFDTIVGREVTVETLGRCVVLAVDISERRAIVQKVGATGDEGFSVPFRAVFL